MLILSTIFLILYYKASFCQSTNSDSVQIDFVATNSEFDELNHKLDLINQYSILYIIIIPIASITVALITVFISRNTEFKKAIILKRVDVFTKFVSEWEESVRNIRSGILDACLTKDAAGQLTVRPEIEVPKHLWPIIKRINTTKLILNRNDRDEFYNLYKIIKRMCISSYLEDGKYIDEIDDKFLEIERIFENNLKNVKL